MKDLFGKPFTRYSIEQDHQSSIKHSAAYCPVVPVPCF